MSVLSVYVQNRCMLEWLKYCAFNIYPTIPALANLMVMELTTEEAELNSVTNQSTVHLPLREN